MAQAHAQEDYGTKESNSQNEDVKHDDTHEIAEHGHAATDIYGKALIEFDPKAEARLRLKIDLYIIPTVAILYLFCFIDRANIGNARLAGFEKDLKLKGYDYNTVLSMFYISYIIFEIPSNMCCKWIGPGWFIPTISLCFGITSLGTAFVQDISSACGVRFLLGIFEAGMLPGIAYYLSRWYRRSELAFRLAMYIVMAPLAGAFGGLLASAILTLDSFGSLHRWRMIFAIEGIITSGVALISFFTLTDRPETARWLTQEEKDLAIARVKSERVGQIEVLDKLDKKKTLRGIFNPVILTDAFIFLLDNITVQGLAFFLPTIVKTIYPKNTVVSQQLHTVPPYVVGAVVSMIFPYLCGRFDRRMIFFIASAPLMMIGYIMFLASKDHDVRYGATFLIASGAFTFGSLVNALASANVVSDTARASGIGTVVMFGNVGGLISTWSFLPTDAPNYPIGNGLNLATSSTILISSILLLLWMNSSNKKRQGIDVAQELAGKSAETNKAMPSAITIRQIEGKPGKVYYPLEKITVPEPKPKDDEAVITLSAAALNHRDLFIRQHLYPGTTFGVPLLADGVGTVTSTGSSPSARAWLNKRVLLNPGTGWASSPDGPEHPKGYAIMGGTKTNRVGTLQDVCVLPASELEECPTHLSDAEAAALPLTGLTAWRAFRVKSGNAMAGRNILVTGIGGGVALMVLGFAVSEGCNVYVTSGDQAKIDKAVALGAKGGVIYKESDWDAKLKDMLPADRKYLDAIIDGAGGDVVKVGSKLLKAGGVISIYGMTVSPKMDFLMSAVLRNIEVRGSTMGSRKEFKDMVQFVRETKMKPVVSRTVQGLDVDKIDGLFEDMKSAKQFGKLVVMLGGWSKL
ncbi:MFS transporter [Pyrenophora seminiperda CCB06]|uniref:MFS transporter n=1 Tax=Pyrenophora seminiperda CCB06 TaxID=1302712 RepID=A0A3M7MC09_9PLEO|nr:MFS transporter [Pyrenophora seminiperda CCB06]